MTTEEEGRRERRRNFTNFGVGIGGLVPVVGLGIAQQWCKLIPESTLGWYWGTLAAFLITVYCGMLVVDSFITDTTMQDLCTLAAAVLSIFYLNIFVFVTGGPMVSVFSFHYFYIPIIVRLSFVSGFGLAVFGCWASCICNLYVTTAYHGIRDDAERLTHGTAFVLFYAGVFSVQIFMAWYLEKYQPIRLDIGSEPARL